MEQGQMRVSVFLVDRCGIVVVVLAMAIAGAAPARAQNYTFGTDQRYCDNSALSKIFSTSKGNLIGSAAGGAIGGLLGNQVGKGSGNTLSTIVGVLGGALAGGYVGRSMDQTDQGCVGETLEHTPTSQSVAWRNPASGSSYWVTPTANLTGPNGEPCRNYITDAVVNGQAQRTENTACRQADGRWVPASQEELQGMRAAARTPAAATASLSSDMILKVQQRLHDLGFYVRDNIDGQWGPHTSGAVKNFQRSEGLDPSGQLDMPTLSALNLLPGGGR
jgi:surface antigen